MYADIARYKNVVYQIRMVYQMIHLKSTQLFSQVSFQLDSQK